LPDGSTRKTLTFTTRRKRAVGEIVNLPDGLDGRPSSPTKGYIWRVKAIEPHEAPLIEALLVLTYERPHPETVE